MVIVKGSVIIIKIKSNKLRLLMAEQGKTQTSLAPLCGISRQSISNILARGTAAPKNAVKLAKALGVPVAEIIGGDTNA